MVEGPPHTGAAPALLQGDCIGGPCAGIQRLRGARILCAQGDRRCLRQQLAGRHAAVPHVCAGQQAPAWAAGALGPVKNKSGF